MHSNHFSFNTQTSNKHIYPASVYRSIQRNEQVMPSSTSSSTSSSSSSSSSSSNNNNKININGNAELTMSDYEFLKPWGGMNDFMLLCGLKMYNQDDVEEGMEILRFMKEAHLQNLAEEQSEKEQRRGK